jgi:pimeloyl-ACP methyl ester carboxylesterase
VTASERSPLAHDRRGDGEPLVLLHPLGADRGVWEPVLDQLADERDVIAADLPGFGESPSLPDEVTTTPAALARAVADLLDSLGIERAHASGISLGAWVALELAKIGRARSVTALCPAGFWPRPLGPRPELARRSARLLRPILPALTRTSGGRTALLQGVVARPANVPPAAALRLVRAYIDAPGFDRANREMRGSVFSGFETIDVPVTLAWSEYDRLVGRPRKPQPDWVRQVALDGCGHVPTWDDPPLVAHTILESSGSSVAVVPGRLSA